MRRESSKGLLTLSAVVATAIATGCGGKMVGREEPKPTEEAPAQQEALITELSGVDAVNGKLQSSAVQMHFALGGKDSQSDAYKQEGFECRFGKDSKFVPCKNSTFSIAGLKDGSEYHFGVRAVVREKSSNKVVLAKEATTDFKVDLSQGDQASQTALVGGTSAISHVLQVGSVHAVTVPSGMHVTEYATSKTTGVLNFFRILPEADASYLGNFSCTQGWDRVVASVTPAGEALMYCHSTPTREAFKDESEFRLAQNHVEIATDTQLITDTAQERLVISSYDADYELMARRSRFVNTCQDRVKKYIDAPFVPDFFLGNNPQKTKFWYCDNSLPGMDGKPQVWRIGAFYENDVLDWNDPAHASKSARGLEVVYMARANGDILMPESFARRAQERILGVLDKVLP